VGNLFLYPRCIKSDLRDNGISWRGETKGVILLFSEYVNTDDRMNGMVFNKMVCRWSTLPNAQYIFGGDVWWLEIQSWRVLEVTRRVFRIFFFCRIKRELGGINKPGIPHGTTRGPYDVRPVVRSIHRTYHTCGGKSWIFFLSLCIPLSPLSTKEVPPGQNYFFFIKKKSDVSRKREGNREMSSPGLGKVHPVQRTTILQ
jgi:hypothetical protein